LRASYPIIDHRERFIAPHSMIISHDGSTLICGCDQSIVKFDIDNPGEPLSTLYTLPTKKTKGPGYQRGIISALALDLDTQILAAGSFSGSLGLYSDGGEGDLITLLDISQSTGVTQVEWAPNGRQLYVASRKSDVIEIWDVRSTSRALGELVGRNATTNQRLHFDISKDGSWLVAGSVEGQVNCWSLDFTLEPDSKAQSSIECGSKQAVGSSVLHPSYPILATCSGSRVDNEDDGERIPTQQSLEINIWSFD
jgi:WD40 repeat protein